MAKILVVDDDQQCLEFVEDILGEEHEVFTVDSWTKINEYLFKHDPDLILLDVNLPGFFQGDKIAELLMNRVKQKPVNIVLFSSMDEYDLRKKAKEAGVKGYICKTFDKHLLRTRVARYLEGF